MKTLRIMLSCLVCRAVSFLLHLTGRGGTSLPGKMALFLCPDILETVSEGMRVVLVTGTNGKTTTTRMLEQICVSQGIKSFSNSSGANLKSGLATEFILHSDLFGRPSFESAVIEVDEAVLHTVSGHIKPAAVIVTNVFRDQLDRFGEVTGTVRYIKDGLKKVPDAVLCLNADCMLTVSAGDGLPNPKLYFGIDVPLSGQSVTVSDVPRCLSCGGTYRYHYRTYAHLGGYYCPSCGRTRPYAQAAVTQIASLNEDSSEVVFRLGKAVISGSISVPAVYNIYNAVSALSGAMALGLDMERAVCTLSDITSGFGRMERMDVGGVDVRVILVKNPVGLSRALDYLCTRKDAFLAVFCLNDRINDGTDVSWIWDADFDALLRSFRESGSRLAAAGTRAGDMLLRLKYAGFEEDSIRLAESMEELVGIIASSPVPVCVLPNYTAMLEIREKLASLAGTEHFWKT